MTSEERRQRLEQLSAAMDGECESTAVAAACAGWREGEAGVREAWCTWHLIGDVLRSDELAVAAPRDARLLDAVQRRLAQEPALLAPSAADKVETPPAGPRGSRWSWWTTSAAVAAGFAAVAGAVLVLQPSESSSGAARLARVETPPATSMAVATTVTPLSPFVDASSTPAAATVATGEMIRDARLQQYLAAHKQFGGSTALGAPSAFLRSATVELPAR